MNANSWLEQYQEEIEHAIQARQAGNEGMARVCARRAAGIVIGEYLQRNGIEVRRSSAYDRIQQFMSLNELSTELLTIAGHLSLRVTIDHQLPLEVDLISETKDLAQWLLGEAP